MRIRLDVSAVGGIGADGVEHHAVVVDLGAVWGGGHSLLEEWSSNRAS